MRITRSALQLAALAVVSSYLASACSGPNNEEAIDSATDQRVADPVASDQSEPAREPSAERMQQELFEGIDWDAYGVEPPEVTEIGPIDVIQPDGSPRSEVAPPVEDSGEAEGEGAGEEPSLAFMAVDVAGEYAYKVQFTEAHFEAFRATPAEGGSAIDNAGNEVLEETAQQIAENQVEKAWSNGTDTRIVRGEAEGFSENHNPYNRIGWLSGGCTGTYIGRRMVLTAAHCVLSATGQGDENEWDRNGELAYDWDLVHAPPTYSLRPAAVANDFYPRLDRNNVAISWATVRGQHYLVPLEYTDGTCTNITNCNRYDFAMILTSGPNPSGVVAGGTNNHPGYVGWRTRYKSWHDDNPTWMRGYPGCGTGSNWTRAARPGGWNSTTCVSRTLYGDTEQCNVGTGSNTILGYFSEYTIDCDGSPGMSGSSFYVWQSSNSTAYTVGVYSQESCAGNPGQTGAPTCVGVTHPGQMTMITPDRGDLISVYRNTTYNTWP